MKSVSSMGKFLLVACLLATALALGACRDSEEHETIHLKKGSYPGGNPSTPMSQEAVRDLRSRFKEIQGYH